MFLRRGIVAVLATCLAFVVGKTSSLQALDGEKDSSAFPHGLEFETDGELPSVEGAADGWEETAWNLGQAPSLEVSDGLLKFNSFSSAGTASGTPWMHMDGGSAWEAEVTAATSYTLETSVKMIAAIGGMIIWAGNGGNRLILRVDTGSISADGTGELDASDNTAGQVAVRIAYDGAAQTYDVWRDGVQIGNDLAPSAADGNNRLIFFDCCSSTAAEGELEYLRWTATGAFDTATDSSTFDHKLEFETDGQIPSEEGAADGWAEVNGWNIPGFPPSIAVSGGTLKVDTVGVGGGHDVRQPVDTSAWAMEVDPGTSYTFETRLKVTDQGGGSPGFSIWLGNGVAAETAVAQVRTNELMWGTNTQLLNEGDNSTDFVTVRIAHDGDIGLHTVWRNGIEVGSGLGPTEIQSANNWIILVDFGGANEVAAEVDYVRWDATGFFPPPSGGGDTEPPAAPTGLVAQGGVNAIALDWDSNTEDDLASYNVYRSASVGGPYDLLAGPVSSSAYVDETPLEGVTNYYVVTAVDASDNESDPSDEASAAAGFGEERDPDTFAHCLNFDTDGQLPSLEGIADGWTESASWNQNLPDPPTLSVAGGLLQFNSALPGQHSIDQFGGSAWEVEVSGATSYTFEVSVRAIETTGGVIFWLANGSTRMILRVDTNSINTFSGVQLHEGDNSSRLVTVRIGYDGVSGLYYVWRNGILIGEALPAEGAASGGRKAIFLIDCCSTTQAMGEFDYVCFDTSGLFPPATIVDETPPDAPTGLVATAGINAVALDWDTNTEKDLASYNVYRSEVSGGPYDVLVEGVTASEHVDATVLNGIEYFYVVTAVDGSENESAPSDEANATPDLPEERDADTFPHCLAFEENGVLPSVEGAADGWQEDAAWNQNDPDPPTLGVFGGRLFFETVLPGQQSITMQAGSAWETHINPSVSYTFEVSLRVLAGSGDNPGVTLWLANGQSRLVLRVGTQGVSTLLSGLELDAEGDNSSDFVTIRAGYDSISGLYYVWRDGELIGDGIPSDGTAAGGRTAVFLIDCCSSVQVLGEFDHVCWTPEGLFAPVIPMTSERAGDCNSDGSRNIADVVCMIHVLFPGFVLVGGSTVAPPCSTNEGNLAILDLNGDTQLNVSDITYLANFLFGGGGPPVQGTECFEILESDGCGGNKGCPSI